MITWYCFPPPASRHSPFFGGGRLALLPEATRNTAAQREAIDWELHDALLEARKRFNRRVKALLVVPEEE